MAKQRRRLGRPVDTEDASDVVMSVRMSERLANALYDLTREDGSTLSALIREGLREYVNRRMSNLVPAGAPETRGTQALVTTWRHAR